MPERFIPEPEQPRPELESNPDLDIRFVSVQRILETAAQVESGTDYTLIQIDVDKVKAILANSRKIQQERQSTILPAETFSQEELIKLRQEMQHTYVDTLQMFVSSKLITSEQMAEIATRLLPASQVQPTNESFDGFSYAEYYFPANPESAGHLTLSLQTMQRFSQSLENLLTEQNINLSPDQLRLLALRRSLAHECGHAIDRHFDIQRFAQIQPDQQDLDYATLIGIVKNEADNTAAQIAPNPALSQLFAQNPDEVKWARTERVAMGCEYLGLQAALTQGGVSADSADRLVQTLRRHDQSRLAQLQELVDTGQKHGFSLANINQLIAKINAEADQHNFPPDYLKAFPNNYWLEGRQAGYYASLSSPELTAYFAARNQPANSL